MLYYVLTLPGGTLISAEESVFRNSEGYVSATMVPEGAHMLPFRSLLAAYRHIQDRETMRWKTETTFSIRKGYSHGYYAVAHHHTHYLQRPKNMKNYGLPVKEWGGQNVEYLILPVETHDPA